MVLINISSKLNHRALSAILHRVNTVFSKVRLRVLGGVRSTWISWPVEGNTKGRLGKEEQHSVVWF